MEEGGSGGEEEEVGSGYLEKEIEDAVRMTDSGESVEEECSHSNQVSVRPCYNWVGTEKEKVNKEVKETETAMRQTDEKMEKMRDNVVLLW